MHGHVTNPACNPRAPRERRGIVLVLSISGLHALPEMPQRPDDPFNELIAHAYALIVSEISDHGGEVLRMLGEVVIAIDSSPDLLC